LLHVLLNNTGAGTEWGGGFLITGIPLLIVMQSLSVDTQRQHMSCQQMIFQLLLKQIYEIKFKYDFMQQLNFVTTCFLSMKNSVSSLLPPLSFSMFIFLQPVFSVLFLSSWHDGISVLSHILQCNGKRPSSLEACSRKT